MESEKSQDSVRAVDRALEILLAFRAGDQGLTVTDVAKRVDLSRATVHRLLNTLEANRFLVSSGDPQRFSFGNAIAQLAHLWAASSNIQDIAQPMMRRLWEATQETVALFVPEGNYRRCVAEMESPQPLSFKRGVGYREKLVLGASGRSILAHMELTAAGLKACAMGADVRLEDYPKELAKIRRRGFAMAKDELIRGAVATAAPFFDGSGQVAGSICIFGPSVRVSTEEATAFGQLLVTEAAELSRALGQGKPPAQRR